MRCLRDAGSGDGGVHNPDPAQHETETTQEAQTITAWMKAFSHRSQDVYQQITDRCDGSLDCLVEDIGTDGQICMMYHTICLSDTGESAEWKKNENWVK